MKLFVRLILSIALMSLNLCVLAQSVAVNRDEEYRVYDAAIAKMFAGGKVNFDTQEAIGQIIIRDRATTDYASGEKKENWEQVKIRLPNLSEDTIADFEANLKRQTELQKRFDLPFKYSLFSKQDYDLIFDAGGNYDLAADNWSKFYDRFPGSGGHISLSNVGFNKAQDQALVYFVHWCGTLCGTGHYIVLAKSENRWQVVGIGMIWIS